MWHIYVRTYFGDIDGALLNRSAVEILFAGVFALLAGLGYAIGIYRCHNDCGQWQNSNPRLAKGTNNAGGYSLGYVFPG